MKQGRNREHEEEEAKYGVKMIEMSEKKQWAQGYVWYDISLHAIQWCMKMTNQPVQPYA